MKRGPFRLGNRIAPPRFLAFCLIAAIATPIAIGASEWSTGLMIAFDIAALVFLVSLVPLLGADTDRMRVVARDNDANRALLLLISAATMIAILAAVAAELAGNERTSGPMIVLIVATLMLAWCFANTVYALHYAHLFYSKGEDGDAGGLDFPKTETPAYWDFIYFAFTLGMTFQTSDTAICTTRLRRVVTLHSMVAFVFNLGVIAFTINVLGGG
ncbi:DUF1345 domain-containing protein [Sphingomonas sp.]|uniref:DUF1345 domain-containing protein n=1 Tax=Sphingomonas sp. TaxID=28214 RepID=UPI001EC693F1|nr:DUF1345 domain-containing protein [Sphingomonas sp.]MBX3595711.1 DUF1345 domain-containing protein [Sphingomonas sp.]